MLGRAMVSKPATRGDATPTTMATRPVDSAATPLGAKDNSRDAISAMLSPWPAIAHAQSAGGARGERYAPISGLDASRLQAGRRTYVRMSANDYHASIPHEVWTNTLDTVLFRGVRAWRLVRRVDRNDMRGGTPSVLDDTLWLRAHDLRPLARHMGESGTIVSSQRFTDSTMVEHDTIKLPEPMRRSMSASVRRRLPFAHTLRRTFDTASPYVASAEMLRILLNAAPLTMGWRASVQVPRDVYNALQPNEAGWINLRVAGLDTVQLFGGRIPSWRVVVESEGPPETWFVSQTTGETLITDGPLSASYPESRSMLVFGLPEPQRAPPVRRR